MCCFMLHVFLACPFPLVKYLVDAGVVMRAAEDGGIFHGSTLAGTQHRKYLNRQTMFIHSPRRGPTVSVQENRVSEPSLTASVATRLRWEYDPRRLFIIQLRKNPIRPSQLFNTSHVMEMRDTCQSAGCSNM